MFIDGLIKKRKAVVSLHYYWNVHNLGDVLNVPVVEELFNIKVDRGGIATAEMIAIGSILDRLISGTPMAKGKWLKSQHEVADRNSKIHVWGTGLMYLYEKVSEMQFVRPIQIHALRGELTRSTVERMLGKTIRCPTGDPGLLAPLLLEKYPEKQYSLGIIPHYIESDMEEFSKLQKRIPDSIIIDITGEPKEVLTQIASCDHVISTSLHGLIVADAFRIPNKWCKLTDRILGNGFKYRDYYSGYNVIEEVFDLNSGQCPSLYDIRHDYKIKDTDVVQKQLGLVKSFPYKSNNIRKLCSLIVKSIK